MWRNESLYSITPMIITLPQNRKHRSYGSEHHDDPSIRQPRFIFFSFTGIYAFFNPKHHLLGQKRIEKVKLSIGRKQKQKQNKKESWSTFNSDDPLNQDFLFLHEIKEHWLVKLWDTVASFEDIDHMTRGHMKCPSDKRSTRWKGNMVVVTSMLSGTVLIYRNFGLHTSRKPRCMCNEMIMVSQKPHETIGDGNIYLHRNRSTIILCKNITHITSWKP